MLLKPAWASIPVIDLPTTPGSRYDLTWTMTVNTGTPAPCIVKFTGKNRPGGYRLIFANNTVSWQPDMGTATTAPFPLLTQTPLHITLKRRPGTIAVLINHRLVLAAAHALAAESITFPTVPPGIVIADARYSAVTPPRFGDDFMRPEALERLLLSQLHWVEDDIWKVAYYQKDEPGKHPQDAATGEALTNPWQLSIFPVVTTTTNGFWLFYTGSGPSWVVANPSLAYPSWDRYYVQAAVKPEFQSEVGVIAAYQDNRNYLLFRWKQREQQPGGIPRAELIAMIDGTPQVLASAPRGFDPGQWYTLRINLGWQRVQAVVDGEVLLDAVNSGPGEGRVGLYANGVDTPQRPPVDDTTAAMYVTVDTKTGETINEAQNATGDISCIYFDDVRVGEWITVNPLRAPTYAVERSGQWGDNAGTITTRSPGRMLFNLPNRQRYSATLRVQIPPDGTAGVLLKAKGKNGYAWMLDAHGQRLQLIANGKWKSSLVRTPIGLAPGQWANLRVEVDGPYFALLCNGQRVMDYYDPLQLQGDAGILASTPGVQFSAVAIEQTESPYTSLAVHPGFEKDRYLVAWATPEADWTPAFPTSGNITPNGLTLDQAGAAAPLPTDQPGLYWHKGGHYRDLSVTVPLRKETLSGQTLHLATNYRTAEGYRIVLQKRGEHGSLQLLRGPSVIGDYHFTVTAKSQLLIERRGTYLLLRVQALDPAPCQGEPAVLQEQLLVAYRDPHPLPAEQVGFTVTSPRLPAAQIRVESTRRQDAFEQSPTDWVVQSGIWRVMARYSCSPQWNWFGGFGGGTPTVWSKTRLDGDQIVEAYLGIKMRSDEDLKEYYRRYRDTNVTICADGEHVNSGYSVVRAGRIDGKAVTLLLRKGEIVQRSTDPAALLPTDGKGHRHWFATRIEKRGGELKVFLDNRLMMTYMDPNPLPGGLVALWSLNNGIMVGRVNLAAEQLTVGHPKAEAPLIVQETLPPLPVPAVTVNAQPATPCTFETGLEGWAERPGFSGRLVRERIRDERGNSNTFLKVVNTYPAGDCSLGNTTPRDIAQAPNLHFDYCFDKGTQINLYLRQGDSWYGCLLTGESARQGTIYPAGKMPALADGKWRHCSIDLGKLLTAAVTQRTGTAPKNLTIDEMVFADWSTPAELRAYGFGHNPGGTAIRFDNILFTPRVTAPLELAWQFPHGAVSRWRIGLDTCPESLPSDETMEASRTITPVSGQFFHLQGVLTDGTATPVLHVPLTAISQ
ncbi:MAG: LamG domain-containing protein [Armatimonadota bacterium]